MEPDKQYNMTPEEEERLIENEFQDVLQGYLKSNHRKKVEIIERAFRFAKKAHGGIRRRSGEPYILHPIAVAKIASQEIGLGSTSICAALLHDVVEDTDYTVEDIERLFGSKIAQIVAGLPNSRWGILDEQAAAQAGNFRKLHLPMSKDSRVELSKLGEPLHSMRTTRSLPPAQQYKIAGETLYIYAPLAHRLGLFEIKTELEDLSFKYEHPKAYERISELIRQSEARRSAVYNDFATPILAALDKMNLRYEAKARLKSVYSIWRKMETKHVPFEEIYDLYAMRIIFDCDDPSQEKGICWSIYSAITDLYRLHPDRTRDWVSIPKANGYQALHLTVMGPDGNWVEVQIRSRRMDEIAEKGFAAHWKYKSGESDEESELNEWLRTIKDILDDPNPNAIDFLDTLKMNLFASEIAVFTPKGRVITMPADSSVLDVAFELHSEIGTHCIAGKVNHKLVPLSHRLQSGDQVEVLTSQSQTPKEEWLPFLATAKGRTRLKAALRKVQQPVIDSGKGIFDQYFKEREVEATNEIVTKMLAYYHLPSREALYMKLGQGSIDLSRYILKESPKTEQSLLSKLFRIKRTQQPQIVTVTPEKVNVKKTYALRCTDTERNYVLSDCCHPIPGDDVMGYVNDRGQVELHSLTCPRAQALKAAYGPRIVSTEWEQVKQKFLAEIRIEGVDRHGILQELTQMISNQLNIDIRSLHIDTDKEVFACSLTVLVSDTQVVGELCQKIKKIKGVQNAARVADTPD